MMQRHLSFVLAMGVLAPAADQVAGQNYPARPVRLVTAEPGGGVDFAARLVAQGLSGNLGQQVIVDNRGGASGVIAGEIVAKAPPDGYTYLFYGSALWLLPFLRDNIPYDPVKDFSAVTLAVNSPNVVVVHPSLAAGSVKELISLAKARPGQLNYASGSTGSSNHLAAELFGSMADIKFVRITYKGAGAALNDLIAGQMHVMFPNAAAVIPHVKTGRLRALAVTSPRPSALMPGFPTVAESGLPGYESGSILSVFAPARMPAALIQRFNREIVQVLNRPDVKDKFFSAGSEVIASSPGELDAARKSDMAKLGKLIKDIGIRE